MASTSNKILASTVGRRKTSVASVRLMAGTGIITINGKPADKYFTSLADNSRINLPFKTSGVAKYDASIKVAGGGPNGQMEASTLGIARALVEIKADFKPALRTAGLLTRDSRKRQRRMIGTGGKARRQKQSPKR